MDRSAIWCSFMLLYAFLLLCSVRAEGKRCYKCEYFSGDNTICISNPSQVRNGEVDCEQECIVEEEYDEIREEVRRLKRYCDHLKLATPRCHSEHDIRTCKDTCNDNLCNGGRALPENVEPLEPRRCYTCSYTYTDAKKDIECVTNPGAFPSGSAYRECNKTLSCVSVRQYDHHLNDIRSFSRTCGVPLGNKCVNDTYFNTCFITCDTDLCNGGDGIYKEPKGVQTSNITSIANVMSLSFILVAFLPIMVVLTAF